MLSQESLSFLLLVSIKIRSINIATLFTLIYSPWEDSPARIVFALRVLENKPSHFHFREQVLILFRKDLTSISKLRQGHLMISARLRRLPQLQYIRVFFTLSKRWDSYCSNWCYPKKLFLREWAILHDDNWHLMRNLWLSKCCNSAPFSISERIKIDFKKNPSRIVSNANHTDSPKRCVYIYTPTDMKLDQAFPSKKVTAI